MLESIRNSAILWISHHCLEYSSRFREILIKIGAKFDEKRSRKAIFVEFRAKIRKSITKFCSNFEIGTVQRIANLVVLEKCCKMRIWVPKSASMQKRTSPLKFGDLAEKSGLNSVSNLSTKTTSRWLRSRWLRWLCSSALCVSAAGSAAGSAQLCS